MVHITRVRTGCLTCRSRKKKCDEQRPVCCACRRNGFDCTWPVLGRDSRTASRTQPRHERALRLRSSGHVPVSSDAEATAVFSPAASPPVAAEETPEEHGADNEPQLYCDDDQRQQTGDTGHRDTARFLVETHSTAATSSDASLHKDLATASKPLSPTSVAAWLDRNRTTEAPSAAGLAEPSMCRLWDYCGEEGFRLLGHYLSRTCLVLSGGIRSDNPFLSQLMPIAMSNDLIMHLVLTMSAAHSAVASPMQPAADVANVYYNRSLALFRRSISSYGYQDGVTPLVLALGSLLLCFTETIRGDCCGAIFKHLKVADTLIVSVLRSTISSGHKSSLEDFLVEFYIYVVTLSLVSLEPQQYDQFQMHDLVQSRAHVLASESFVGNLCGCWIELLLLIPRINRFAAQNTPLSATETTPITGDRVAHFAMLHAETLAWSPYKVASPILRSSGIFYQNAVLLYLYTSAFEPAVPLNSLSADLVSTTISAALSRLEEIDPTDPINTLLCWPVAIVGACLSDEEQRDLVRQRLKKLEGSLTIANITDLLSLLEALWDDTAGAYAGPWGLHRLMKARNLWFSMA
ncbi:hypothetical protein LZ32DRAFT_637639 [Colletotrichum eremochloae]|nr:hypothetical protein LZ32DRAFT_637639 [Colletotrichum eremochloae]